MSDEILLRVGRSVARVAIEIVERFGTTRRLSPFLIEEDVEPNWAVRFEEKLSEPKIQMTGAKVPGAYARIEGNLIRAEVPEVEEASDPILRLLFYLETVAQKGFLLHASGTVIEGTALIAAAPSGAGKSTLGRLLVEGGAGQLLSDEIIAVYPDGSCHGTPFRSDYEGMPSPRFADIGAFLVPVKERFERMRSLDASRALAALMGQVYWSPVARLPNAEVLRRVGGVLENVGAWELSFRKDPAVAAFLRDWLRERGAGEDPRG